MDWIIIGVYAHGRKAAGAFCMPQVGGGGSAKPDSRLKVRLALLCGGGGPLRQGLDAQGAETLMPKLRYQSDERRLEREGALVQAADAALSACLG